MTTQKQCFHTQTEQLPLSTHKIVITHTRPPQAQTGKKKKSQHGGGEKGLKSYPLLRRYLTFDCCEEKENEFSSMLRHQVSQSYGVGPIHRCS